MDLIEQVGSILVQVVSNLTNPDAWKTALGAEGVTLAAFVVLNLIVFTETGLLFGFFLPGDSLLVTAGVVGQIVGWPIHWLMLTLAISAIVGDSVGYWIGFKSGPAIFNRPQSRFFKRDHLIAAKEFYDLHGGKTIVIARFMPFVRTFAPVVAGAARMEYRSFITYNILGGTAWVVSMLLFGYTLHYWADALLKPIFGPGFEIARHIDKVVILVVLVSVAPLAVKWWTHRRAKRRAVAILPTAPSAPTE